MKRLLCLFILLNTALSAQADHYAVTNLYPLLDEDVPKGYACYTVDIWDDCSQEIVCNLRVYINNQILAEHQWIPLEIDYPPSNVFFAQIEPTPTHQRGMKYYLTQPVRQARRNSPCR